MKNQFFTESDQNLNDSQEEDWSMDYFRIITPLSRHRSEEKIENHFELDEIDNHFFDKLPPKISTTPQYAVIRKPRQTDLAKNRSKTLERFQLNKEKTADRATIARHNRNRRLTAAPSRAFANYTSKVLKTYEKIYQKESKFEQNQQKERKAYSNRKTDKIERVEDSFVTEQIARKIRKQPDLRPGQLPQEPGLAKLEKHKRYYYWG